ncbi:MAG: hypothetical protein ACFCU2_09340 [Acidimicrobiia bacterium]
MNVTTARFNSSITILYAWRLAVRLLVANDSRLLDELEDLLIAHGRINEESHSLTRPFVGVGLSTPRT